MKGWLTRYCPGLLLLLFFIVIALATYKDYGVSWDERIQRQMGLVSYNYVFHGDKTLETYLERDHGVGFELVLLGIEKLVKATTYREIFLTRHLASHFFYLLGAFSMYVLVLRLYGKRSFAMLAFLFMVLSPRLYAHSFFNSKDTPLLAMYAISFMVAEWAFRRKTVLSYALLGGCVGYATSIRILGSYLFVWLLLFIALDIIYRTRDGAKRSTSLKGLVAYVLGAMLGVYTFWPTLWKSPLVNFAACYKSLSHFRWDGYLLLHDESFRATKAPWFYLPEWFAITTPLVFLLLGLIGGLWVIKDVVKKLQHWITDAIQRNFLLYLACFIGPFLAIVILDSVVYDDWRHIYFIYPAFVLLSIYTIDKLLRYKLKMITIALILAQFILLLRFMVMAHPLHQVYFNEIVSHSDEYLRKNYEYDFWGASYKQALEYVMQQDKRAEVAIDTCWEPISHNIDFLKEEDRIRVKKVAHKDAEYYLTNFRWHPQDYDFPEIFYELKVQNSTVVRVYKLK